MNVKMQKLLARYLDDQVTARERHQVERLAAQDPGIRAELETLRAFTAVIQASAPPAVAAPAGLREQVIQRLSSGSSGAGPSRGGGAGPVAPILPYLVAGLLLGGSITVFVMLDQQAARRNAPRPGSDRMTEGLVPMNPMPKLELPVLRNPDQTRSERPPQGSFSGSEPDREAYLRGVKADPALEVSAGNRTEAVDKMHLEHGENWTLERVERRLPGQGKAIWAEAQRLELNPGLIVAAKQFYPERTITALAQDVRASLTRTREQADEQRLLDIVRSLGGTEKQLEAWEGYLR